MTSLGILKQNQIGNLLYAAAHIIIKRGQTKGITADPKTGQVSARGALLLAAGAKPKNIIGFATTPEEAKVSPVMIPKVYEAIKIVEYEIDDIDIWNDHPDTTAKTIKTLFTKLASVINLSIT